MLNIWMSLNENAEKQTFYYEIHFFSEERQQIFKKKKFNSFHYSVSSTVRNAQLLCSFHRFLASFLDIDCHRKKMLSEQLSFSIG